MGGSQERVPRVRDPPGPQAAGPTTARPLDRCWPAGPVHAYREAWRGRGPGPRLAQQGRGGAQGHRGNPRTGTTVHGARARAGLPLPTHTKPPAAQSWASRQPGKPLLTQLPPWNRGRVDHHMRRTHSPPLTCCRSGRAAGARSSSHTACTPSAWAWVARGRPLPGAAARQQPCWPRAHAAAGPRRVHEGAEPSCRGRAGGGPTPCGESAGVVGGPVGRPGSDQAIAVAGGATLLAAVAAGGACWRGDEAACSQARREERGKREGRESKV